MSKPGETSRFCASLLLNCVDSSPRPFVVVSHTVQDTDYYQENEQ